MTTVAAWAPRIDRARSHAGRAAAWLEERPPWSVFAVAIAVEWLAVLGLALKVHHNGWIYYQGGDQLWYYTLGWLVAHGHLWQTPVGYLWSFWLAPIARVAGPNVASAMPAIVLLNILVLLPVTMLALYGIAARIGGRLFGYWAMLVWIVVPFVGVLYTNQGYHERYSEAVLPQGLGLTAMADFPTMVATIVAFYFCARAALDATPRLLDGAAGGLAFGAAIAIKPSVSLVLLGPPLALIARRRFAELAGFGAGLVPAVVTLTFWKERGLGQVPLFGSSVGRPPTGVAAVAPVVGLNLHKYFGQLNWHHLTTNIDLLREHFWSGHGAVWLVLAGLIAIGLRSRICLLLVGASFLPFAMVKGAYVGTVEDTATFRYLIPVIPLFVLGLASLVYLVPGTRRQPVAYTPGRGPSHRARIMLLALAVALTAVVPVAAIAAAKRSGAPYAAELTNTLMPVPVGIDVGLQGRVRNGTVVLTWREQHPAGGSVFYRVARIPAANGDGLSCPAGPGAQSCSLSWTEIGVTRRATQSDKPGPGTWVYRVGTAVNWLNDPAQGDIFFTSRPLVVRVP